MSEPHTDCPPCAKCALPCGVPFAAHQSQRDHDPRHLICSACGHDWLERDLDRVAQSWRAEAADWATRDSVAVPAPKTETP